MSSRIHLQTSTTPNIRQEIKDSGLSSREAAKVFNITRAAAQKWLRRDETTCCSSQNSASIRPSREQALRAY